MVFSNYAKLLFIGNEEPSFSDTSNGFKRRATVIHFNRIDNFSKKIFLKKINQERGKFIYQCFELFKKALANNSLTQTTAITQARNKWLSDNDQVQQFLDDNYIVTGDDNQVIERNNMYIDYEAWCAKNGVNALSKRKLSNELTKKGFNHSVKQIKTQNGERPRIYYYQGIVKNV